QLVGKEGNWLGKNSHRPRSFNSQLDFIKLVCELDRRHSCSLRRFSGVTSMRIPDRLTTTRRQNACGPFLPIRDEVEIGQIIYQVDCSARYVEGISLCVDRDDIGSSGLKAFKTKVPKRAGLDHLRLRTRRVRKHNPRVSDTMAIGVDHTPGKRQITCRSRIEELDSPAI